MTFAGPLAALPRNRTEAIAIFGDPGHGADVDATWKHANIVTVRDLPGVPHRWYFETHQRAEPYMREAFTRARAAAPTYTIERAASFVFRHQRHDVTRPLSFHSWGIAVDVDAPENAARTFADGHYPAPWGEGWTRCWPNGLPRAFVEAFESVGFAWGGRWHEYCDPMHFELVR